MLKPLDFYQETGGVLVNFQILAEAYGRGVGDAGVAEKGGVLGGCVMRQGVPSATYDDVVFSGRHDGGADLASE